MIILTEKKFAFLHIPKCGGSTIQKWLRQHLTSDGAFYGKIEHPQIGTVYREHLTLQQLAAHYPDVLETLRASDTFAILRDPLKRFVSALGQYVNEMHGGNITLMSPGDVNTLAGDILDQLETLDGAFRFELTHFIPQADFIELEGVRVARELRPLQQMEATFAELSTRLDIPPPQVVRQNVRKEFRVKALAPILRRLDQLARRVLPRKLATRLNALASGVFQRPKSAQSAPLLDAETARRIRAFYRRDFELLQEISETEKAKLA
ncbi:sulfotransferase family 2 domain-containing protein [Roseobacter weihaiensis]|uniref:sulfotransferase family 2 domain-containing protein n=1 Tax=Roseobacter weihaiensis TaxID=2763262 RepID=UPI001D0B9701|nr:sulfotransferase family 2 domain-containing protein [Roseobacter sp. H9]